MHDDRSTYAKSTMYTTRPDTSHLVQRPLYPLELAQLLPDEAHHLRCARFEVLAERLHGEDTRLAKCDRVLCVRALGGASLVCGLDLRLLARRAVGLAFVDPECFDFG